MNRGRVGEERRGKETDGCPLTNGTCKALMSLVTDLTRYLKLDILMGSVKGH
jgi:hypothetical protein